MKTLLPLVLLAACGTPKTSVNTVEVAETPAAPTLPEVAVPVDVRATTDAGLVVIHPVRHGTVVITVGETVIWMDPWTEGDLSAYPPADILLITDIHGDHLGPAAIVAVSKDSTVVVAPQAVADAWAGTVHHILANEQSLTLGALTVTGVAMYNHTRGPESGGLYHDKGRGNGYLIDVGDYRMYFAGDTACTDEMRALQNVDVAFVPMNLPYTMTPEEAAPCVAAFKPTLAVPFHYRESDLSVFESLLADSGVEVRLLDFYPSAN